MKLEKPLLYCARYMSAHALLCLMTLLLLLGLSLGLWWVSPRAAASSTSPGSATRGGSANGWCQHASVAFDPALSVQELSRLLRAEDAHILYGPDEFGEYQLRFGSAIPPALGLQSLQARTEVQSLQAYTQCQ